MIEVYDSHLHMGMLSDKCIVHPKEVLQFICKHHVSGGIIMPTARVNGGDDLTLYEGLYKESDNLGFKNALYVNRDVLRMFKEDSLSINRFCALKIHQEAVDFDEHELNDVFIMASEIDIPLFIHTSAHPKCRPYKYERHISKFPKQKVVLCHGRPLIEAESLMNQYKNIWIDTAFLSIENLKIFVSHGFSDRILFGSDYPINRWFFEKDETEWYHGLICNIEHSFSKCVANKLLRDNFLKLFN